MRNAVLEVPEKQLLTLAAQFVHVANIVTVAVHVIEDDAARGGPLHVFAKVLSRKAADAAIGFDGPIHSAEALFRGDDSFDRWNEITALEVLVDKRSVFLREFRRIDNKTDFFIPGVTNAEEMIPIRERESTQNTDLRKRAIFFNRQPQRCAMLEKAQLLWIKKHQLRSLDKCHWRFFGLLLDRMLCQFVHPGTSMILFISCCI